MTSGLAQASRWDAWVEKTWGELKKSEKESHALRIEVSKKTWADPTMRARRIEGMEKSWKDPERRICRIAAMKDGVSKSWADPPARARHVAGIRKSWADGSVRARRIEGIKRGRADLASRALQDFAAALALREAAFERPKINPDVWEPVVCPPLGIRFRLVAASVSFFEMGELFRCSNRGRHLQMGTDRTSDAGVDATRPAQVVLEKKRIENMKSRLEDQSIQLSRLAILANQQRISHGDIAKNLVLAVQSLDLELRELSGIEIGQLR